MIEINQEENTPKKSQKSVKILSYELSNLSPGGQFIICSATTIGFYVVYGYMQVQIVYSYKQS